MAELTLISTTFSSLTFCITGLDVNYSNAPRELTWWIDNQSAFTTTVSNGVTQSDSYTFSSLYPSTQYYISATLTYYNGTIENPTTGGTNVYGGYYTTSAYSGGGTGDTTHPGQFSWDDDAPKVKGQPFNLRASEWNRLTAHINKLRVYRGLDTYNNFTTVYTGNQVLADYYNQCYYAMQGLGIGLPFVSKGDQITAELLNSLVYGVNTVT